MERGLDNEQRELDGVFLDRHAKFATGLVARVTADAAGLGKLLSCDIDTDAALCKAHLFDFDGNLYGEWVRVEWVERLRDVKRFASVEALQQQLERDRTRAREVLAAAGPAPSRGPHA